MAKQHAEHRLVEQIALDESKTSTSLSKSVSRYLAQSEGILEKLIILTEFFTFFLISAHLSLVFAGYLRYNGKWS